MNILIPDRWLREYLDTKVKPVEIQKYLSLCGPSVERIETIKGEPVYDIEVTTNRVDMMSVEGIAREAIVILPSFGINATKKNLGSQKHKKQTKTQKANNLDIEIVNDTKLCRRVMAVKLSNIKIGPSPKWMQKRLIQVGQRPLNNAIDITNFVMWEVGHPVHAFDYDSLTKKKIIVREAKKGERLTTLDNKSHTLKGGEVIFDDGARKIIDLPGIMGTANTAVNEKTKNILLFIESVEPVKIRQASMGLAIRTQAAVLNEKNVSPELIPEAINRGVELYQEVLGAKVASKILDIYPNPVKNLPVLMKWEKMKVYLNKQVKKNEAVEILNRLDFKVKETKEGILATAPFWRNDIQIDVDLIEEIARVWGYFKFDSLIPEGKLPQTDPGQRFDLEYRVKLTAKALGYSEINAVPLISEKETLLDKSGGHLKLLNPLGKEWEYLRRSLVPTMSKAMAENERFNKIKLFEMGLVFFPSEKGKLPKEELYFALASTEDYRKVPGELAVLMSELKIEYTVTSGGEILCAKQKLGKVSIFEKFSMIELDMELIKKLSRNVISVKPLPEHQAIVEDITLNLPPMTAVGPIMEKIDNISDLIYSIKVGEVWEQKVTLKVEFNSENYQLTQEAVNKEKDKILKSLRQV